jgi:4-hydroxybenzoate polyprenyltransferase
MRPRGRTFGLVLALLFLDRPVNAFNSRLQRPWERPKRPSAFNVRRYRNKKNDRQIVHLVFYTDPKLNKNYPQGGGDSHNLQESDKLNAEENDHGQHVEEFKSSLLHSMHYTNSSLTSNVQSAGAYESLQYPNTPSFTKVARASASHVWDYRKELFKMTRPENLPGVVLFHMIGSCLSFRHFETVAAKAASTTSFWKLLATPPMLITLAALLLVSSTSMLVNDYYDYKLGNDSGKLNKPKVPMPVVKKALSYLYAISLFCSAMVPGLPGRVAVIGGLILTFLYTKHVKPRTWAKNALCASLISLSPLTSGVAAMSVLSSSFSNLLFAHINWPLVRLVTLLFVGIVGREIAMDINDIEDDAAHSVRTVPVKYGKRFASKIAWFSSLIVAGVAVSGPILDSLDPLVAVRRASLAGVGSLLQVRRYWKVKETQGDDREAISAAIDEGLLSIIVILASFI